MLPPNFISSTYNPSNWVSSSSLTYGQCDARYLQLSGGTLSKVSVSGVASFGSNYAAADSQLNLLDSASTVSFRFGTALSAYNCITQTWNYVGGGSTSNNLAFNIYGNTNQLTISAAGGVGIGTVYTTSGLSVAASSSATIDITAAGVAYFLKTGGLVSTVGPLSSIAVSIKASGAILAGAGVYTTSDRRVKKYIEPIDQSLGDKLMSIDPVVYRYNNQDETIEKQIGYIAQDCIKAGISQVVNFHENEEMKVEDPDVDTEGIQYSIDYSKIAVLLHVALRKQQKMIDDLKVDLDNLYNAKSYADWCRSRNSKNE